MNEQNQTCLWSGEPADNLLNIEAETVSGLEEVYVKPEHEMILRSFLDDVKKNTSRFLKAVIGLPIITLFVVIIQLVTGRPDIELILTIAAMIVLTGAALWRYPFATSYTVKKYGISKSIMIIRIVAVVTILSGVILPIIILLT